MDPARVDLNKLRTFHVIAEQGGVTAAAARLHLTRSAVSHSLAALEEDLGVQLFHRVARRLVLTREGERLRKAFSQVEDTLEEALESLFREQVEVRGSITLGLFLGFSRHRMSDVIEPFLAEHSAARLRLVYDSQTALHDQLCSGRLDMTLSLRPSAQAAARIDSVRLFEQTLVLAARPRSGRRTLDAEAVSRLAVIDYFRSEPLIDRWIRHHFGARRRPRRNVRIWAASADLALELACRGVGACVLPADLVEPHRARGDLVVLRGPKEPLRDVIWLNSLAGRRESALARALRAALETRAD